MQGGRLCLPLVPLLVPLLVLILPLPLPLLIVSDNIALCQTISALEWLGEKARWKISPSTRGGWCPSPAVVLIGLSRRFPCSVLISFPASAFLLLVLPFPSLPIFRKICMPSPSSRLPSSFLHVPSIYPITLYYNIYNIPTTDFVVGQKIEPMRARARKLLYNINTIGYDI